MGPASQPRGQGSRAMMMHALAALVHLIAAVGAGAPMPNPSSDNLSQPVLDHIAGPLLTSAQFLIPSAVAISGIHKMMDHRESGLARRYLDAIEQQVARVVEVPDEAEPVRFAVMEGLPLDAVSPRLRLAYKRLAEAVATVPKRPKP